MCIPRWLFSPPRSPLLQMSFPASKKPLPTSLPSEPSLPPSLHAKYKPLLRTQLADRTPTASAYKQQQIYSPLLLLKKQFQATFQHPPTTCSSPHFIAYSYNVVANSQRGAKRHRQFFVSLSLSLSRACALFFSGQPRKIVDLHFFSGQHEVRYRL